MSILESLIKNATGAEGTRKRQGISWLAEHGLPNRKNEAWKYTSAEKFLSGNLQAPKSEISPALFDLSPFKIFFSNGAPDLERSNLPSGVTLTKGLPDYEAPVQPGFAGALGALNANIGATLNIPANMNSSVPIIVVHENENAPMLFVNVGRMAKVSVLEAYGADKEHETLCTPGTWFQLAEGAHAEHVKTVIGGRGQVHIGTSKATLARDANFESFIFAAGAKLVRQEVEVELNGHGAHTNAHGLFALRADQHADQHVNLLHNAAHTTSEQLFKMVLDDEARGVFTGRLEIAKDAQKVDAAQLNKNLVLSKKAHVDTRPQLLVHADDVKCAHGATVGQLSDEEVFYLQSRGLSQSRAQKILCHAFATETIMRIKAPSLRAWVSDLLYENFEQFALEKFEA